MPENPETNPPVGRESESSAGRELLATLAGLGTAAAAFTATFGGPRQRFWSRMTYTGLTLGGLALATSKEARATRIRVKDIPLGLASAGTLYLTFKAGDLFARRFMPKGDAEIREIYSLRALRPRPEIALRLATIIGPAEELFWRGLIQGGLARRFGRWPGAALATGAYGGVHLVSRNLTLIGAASVAGLHWGVLRALRMPIGALIVSHAVWDIWIFLVQPTGETEVEQGEDAAQEGLSAAPI
ncbi:MAG: CPBP family intramembrane glutamic endopeptidase [Tepidiformaceae bacterium]